ncbi:unnamed protein product [Microthlaspi erraticum]|uniref:Uncharacterized protein n=1 Tax=Microthlaspi erraticum TaxID=1685480 RepID=A0A6D2JTW8_9BRAS|nr:unnamed protein product [Microthlaspi erraticum]
MKEEADGIDLSMKEEADRIGPVWILHRKAAVEIETSDEQTLTEIPSCGRLKQSSTEACRVWWRRIA